MFTQIFPTQMSQDAAPICGVYMASGIYPSETFKLPIYIGSSTNVQDRIVCGHIYNLNDNNHINKAFQNAWNKYGQNSFQWWLLETCGPDQKFEKEQFYLDLYRPFVSENGGFNVLKVAAPGGTMLGYRHTNESKAKMRAAHLGKKLSEETKGKISRCGEKHHQFGKPRSQEIKDKISKSRLGQMTGDDNPMRRPEVVAKVSGKNSVNWGRALPLETREKISKTKTGKKGRPLSPERIAALISTTVRSFRLMSPDGKIVEATNVSEFARQNHLQQGLVSAVLNGKRRHHKGWRLPPNVT